MGDPERPEEARPELDEVNVAAAFPLAPQLPLPLGCSGACKVQDRCRDFYPLLSETPWRPSLEPSPQPGSVFSSAQGSVPGEG